MAHWNRGHTNRGCAAPLLCHKAAATHPLFDLLVSAHNLSQLNTLCPECSHLQAEKVHQGEKAGSATGMMGAILAVLNWQC
jgi:hypothetical protein